MKRATITLNDELERAVDAYLRHQEARPSLTAVVQTALRQYLSERGYVRPNDFA
jgi:metal-responsive CopG/Arc/MetJ family transcriptional regulator